MARQRRQFPQGKYILRTPRKSQNGQVYAIYLYYYYWRGIHIRRSVDLSVSLKDWNQDSNGGAGEFRSSYGPNYKERNGYLKEIMHDIDSKIMDYIKQHGDIDGETIEAFVSGDDKALRKDNGIDFIEFSKQHFKDRYDSGKIGVSSRENNISYINQFAKFLKQEHCGSHGAGYRECVYIRFSDEVCTDRSNTCHQGLASFRKVS